MTEEETEDMADEEEVEMTEEELAEAVGEAQGIDLEEAEEQIDALHDQLDQIKNAGEQIPTELREAIPEDAEQERVMEFQRVITRANLLYRRVENGDNSVVRGE